MKDPSARLLVAGVGNIFLGDDAFGVEVLKRLGDRPLPKSVRLGDFGIRGLDLAYAFLEGYELTILVDATLRGGEPGTLYTLEPELSEDSPAEFDAHGMTPGKVLALAAALGARPGRLILVGCEPTPPDPEADPSLPQSISPPVLRMIEPAAALVESLIEAWLKEHRTPPVAESTAPSRGGMPA